MAKPYITSEAIKIDKGLQVRNAIFDCLEAGKSREAATEAAAKIDHVKLVMTDHDYMLANQHYREICRDVRFTLIRIQRNSRK